MSQLFLMQHSEPNLSDEAPARCELCGSTQIVTDIYTGEEICSNCGCVTNDPPPSHSKSPYGHTYEEYEDKSHHGLFSIRSTYDLGFNTMIWGDKDAYGKQIGSERMTDIRRLQKRNNRSKVDETAARNLNVAMTELDRLASALFLPLTVKEQAAQIYRRALTADLIRGRSIDAFVAASIYATCRMQAIPRSLKVVSDESKREYQEVSMIYRFLLKELKLKPPVDSPQKFIPKLASVMGVPREVERLAMDMLEAVNRTSAVTGKDPRGVAAAALYYAAEVADKRVIQRKMAKASDTTEVTLRNRYRELKRVLGGRFASLY